jgi:hypothetical protein
LAAEVVNACQFANQLGVTHPSHRSAYPSKSPILVEKLIRRPWAVISPWLVLAATLRRIRNSRRLSPIHWYTIAASNLRIFGWARAYPSARRTSMAGEDALDPQYYEHPDDICDRTGNDILSR